MKKKHYIFLGSIIVLGRTVSLPSRLHTKIILWGEKSPFSLIGWRG